MALLRYFKPVSQASESQKATVADHMPSQTECGLSVEEHEKVSAVVTRLAEPNISSQKRQPRGKYIIYSKEDRAAIGKYASENGNERARVKFTRKYPNLSESSVRNFKRMYLSMVREQRKKKLFLVLLRYQFYLRVDHP